MPQTINYLKSYWSRRWGHIIDSDIITDVECSTCGTVFSPHTYAQAKAFDSAVYDCDCL